MFQEVVTVDNAVIFICALIGSFKASVEFDKEKTCFARGVDVMIGLITGMAVVYHFASQLSLALSAMIAVVGGASGAMVLEVLMTMLPSLTKISVKAWLKKWINQ